MRKPCIKNKYNLTPAKIRSLKFDKSKISSPPFWRNDAIDAWCISISTAKNQKDREFGTYNEFWLGIYDEDAKSYAGKIKFHFSAHGGMCHYKISKFFKETEIENEIDLEIQEKALQVLNDLIDKGVLLV